VKKSSRRRKCGRRGMLKPRYP